MRIAGYLEAEGCKITVFHQGMRFTVKFEDGLYEQSFKFRESDDIKNMEQIRQLIDAAFIEEVKDRFNVMRQSVSDLMDRYLHKDDDAEDAEIEYFEEEII